MFDEMPQSNQEKVACLDDNVARLAVDPRNKYRIQTKPHGHGDVHSLLYSSGLLKEWRDAGLKWVLFFQDTNGLLFKAIPTSLGVSATRQYQVNSLAIVRKAKEAIGGITKLTHANGRSMVVNVEYNQLDPLLRASGHSYGDVNCETGFSPFPGNINQLILELNSYIEELSKTRDVGTWKYIEEHRHAYFDKMQENRLQEFKLPEPVLCIGGFLQVELLGRIQRQDMDGLYYICISHVEVVGLPLLPQFDIEIPDSSEKCALKYYPETETPRCTSSAST